MTFEVLINEPIEINSESELNITVKNNYILSLINDFENGTWRYNKFQQYIWNNIKETALSYSERNSLVADGEYSVLSESAKNLRLIEKDGAIGKGSEIAEIILYGIMKNYYSALPVVPKIFYKQNRKDEAKGSDSVHIVIEPENSFSLWLGESKFYNKIEDYRLGSIVDSVYQMLDLEKLKKEISIVTNLSDLNEYSEISDDLKNKIKKLLNHNVSIDNIKPILNIPILLLHECDITKKSTVLNEEYKNSIIEYHKDRAVSYFEKQVRKCQKVHLYESIKFHVVLFPVPDKKTIVDRFINIANTYRG